jgi:hypothetical protein
METMKGTASKPILVKIAKSLVKTQKEIDDLAVQFALGKAEAADKFDEIKKASKATFQDLRNSLILAAGEERVHALREQLDDLEVQFALGKAETAEFFEEQRHKITKSLHDLEVELKSRDEFANAKNFYVAETEKLKLKFDILKKKFESKSIDTGQLFKDKMQQARKEINTLMSKAEDKWGGVKDTYEDFTDEIREANKHIKKAIDAL